MSTIYLTQYGTEVAKDGGRLCIKTLEGDVKYVPVSYAKCLVIMSQTQITYAAIIEILKNGGSIVYIDNTGNIIGEIGRSDLNKRLMIKQLAVYLNEEKRIDVAKRFVYEKIVAQRDIINVKNKTVSNEILVKAAKKLHSLARVVPNQTTINKLMGIEGLASKTYFDVFGILYNDNCFKWNGRSRRPANDPMNAMLNFGYSLLEKDVRRSLATKGLEVSIGYLHSLDLRKDSLIFDVMEKFRPLIVDRFVMRCISWKMFSDSDFEIIEGRCLFNEKARNKFIAEYEKYVGSYDDDLGNTLRGKISDETNTLEQILRNLYEGLDLSINL